MNPKSRAQAIQKVTIVGVVTNFLLAFFKVVVGMIGNSGALIADGIHSFSDLLSDGVIFYTAKYSSEEADDEHPYGHARFETIVTLGLSVVLTIVGVIIVIDAFSQFQLSIDNNILTHSTLLLSFVVLSIVSKEALYWYTLKISKTCKSTMLKVNAWHHRTDALSSIAVLIGIIGVLNGYLLLDSIAAMVIGFMIIYVAWGLGLGAVKELVDTSIGTDQIQKLRNAIGQVSGVHSVHSLRTRTIGHMVSCDVHVQVYPFLSVSEGHMVGVSVERVAKECIEDLNDITVHIDPEDDEIKIPYEKLPERSEALNILKKALLNSQYNIQVERIQLHYLEGKIHVDFYLSLSCLKSNKHDDKVAEQLQSVVNDLDHFGKVKVYFSL